MSRRRMTTIDRFSVLSVCPSVGLSVSRVDAVLQRSIAAQRVSHATPQEPSTRWLRDVSPLDQYANRAYSRCADSAAGRSAGRGIRSAVD